MQRNNLLQIRKVFYRQINNEPKKLDVKVLKASNYLQSNHRLFANIVSKVYNITDHICKDYPKYFSWYLEKTVPGLLKGTREIMIAIVNKKVAGIICLKNENSEKKLCTLLILEEFRGHKIATQLLEEAFKYLGTTKPLISIPNYKIDQFSSIIKKYNWKQTQVLSNNYYNNASQEIVFNGKIL